MKSKWKLPRLTLKPMKVYKVIVVRENHRLYNEFETYLYRAAYTRGKVYRADWTNLKVINSLFKCITRGKDDEIECGFFHSFKNYNDAKELMEYEQNRNIAEKNNFAVVECTIPSFTLYYKGKELENVQVGEEIASRRIKFNSIFDYVNIIKRIHDNL